MADYIEREWLLDVVENVIQWDTDRDRNRAIHQVRELTPAADVVECKRGEWIDNENETVSCSICKTWFPKERLPYLNYCGFCGAEQRR